MLKLIISVSLLIAALNGGTTKESTASESESCCPILFRTAEYDISYDPLKYQLYFLPIEYDIDGERFQFSSKKEISHIELEFAEEAPIKLIVQSHNFSVDKALLETKQSKMAIYFQDSDRAFEIFVDRRN